MAIVALSPNEEKGHGYLIVAWKGLSTGDQGAPYHPPAGYHLESIHITGTIGGSTITIQGSNVPDETSFADITDSSGSTTNFLGPITEARAFRPDVSGGTGVDADLYAYFREGN